MRELAGLPTEAQEIISNSQRKLTRRLIRDIEAEEPKLDAIMIADVVLTFLPRFLHGAEPQKRQSVVGA
jgi:hypothetical protein